MTVGMMHRRSMVFLGVYIDDVLNDTIMAMSHHDIIMPVVMMLKMIMHREQHHQHKRRYQQGADESAMMAITQDSGRHGWLHRL